MVVPAPPSRATVVIAAWNEADTLRTNLLRLLEGNTEGELDVVVVANGCTDETAATARTVRGVRVIELPEPSKARALNAGDAVAGAGARVYLDADIGVSGADVHALLNALDRHEPDGSVPLVAVPDRIVVTTGRPWPVRAYHAIQRRLPAARTGLFGRGMIALAPAGRARFDRFPDAIADDLFLDGLFAPDERIVVHSVHTRVQTPPTTRALVRRLTRVRRGNRELRAAVARGEVEVPRVRPTDRGSWWRDVVRPEPRLLAAGAVYASLTALAELRARRTRGAWANGRTEGPER